MCKAKLFVKLVVSLKTNILIMQEKLKLNMFLKNSERIATLGWFLYLKTAVKLGWLFKFS